MMPISLQIQDLRKHYRGAAEAALAGIDLDIEGGRIFGLIGPNGAGKSTLVRCLLGLEKPDAGEVQVGDWSLSKHLSQIRKVCGLAPQEPGYYPKLSVAENLTVFGRAWGLRGRALANAVHRALEATHLVEYSKGRAEHLSGGQRQRMNLSMALLNEPKILLLDEPTAGVDAQSRRFMLEMLKSQRDQGTTVIYTSHYLTEIEQLCDRIAVINRGQRLFQGSLAQLKAGHPNRLVLELPDHFSEPPTDCGLVRQKANLWEIDTTSPMDCLQQLRTQGIEPLAIHYGPENLEQIYFSLIEAAEPQLEPAA